eukprot:2809821-Rhodomonas_salina.2
MLAEAGRMPTTTTTTTLSGSEARGDGAGRCSGVEGASGERSLCQRPDARGVAALAPGCSSATRDGRH